MITIKKLTSTEAREAQQIFILFQEDDGITNPSCPPLSYTKSQIENKTLHVFAAFDSDRVIGGICAYELQTYKKIGTELFLYELVVHRDYRRKRIGSKLIEYVKQFCTDNHISEMFVLTQTKNSIAQSLYSSTGGVPDPTILYLYDTKPKPAK